MPEVAAGVGFWVANYGYLRTPAEGVNADLIEQYRNKQYVAAPKSIQDLS
jgi:hypothetical protein